MNFLLVHQNFPGQFRHVGRVLAERGNGVVAIGDAANNVTQRPPLHPAVKLFAYRLEHKGSPATHHYIRDFEGAVRRGQAAARAAMELKKQGFAPDVVLAHPAWGEALFLKDVFPAARHIYYFEYYYHGEGGDVGFDPEFPATFDDKPRLRVKNTTQLLSLEAADAGISPTTWQADRYPIEFRHKIEVMHEGIDTETVRPDTTAVFEWNGLRLTAADEVVTYVARNLEPYRGFHVFMRALPRLLAARPRARVVIVGGDDVSYGRRLPEGQTYRAKYLAEMAGRIDPVLLERVHFTGRLPYEHYLRLLQVSSAHVYLTYPFVLSWSMLEAMAAGCLILASNTAPVCEVVEEGVNGCLVDFFAVEELADVVADVLARPADFVHLRKQARDTICARYDLHSFCLPRWVEVLAANTPLVPLPKKTLQG
jgi:glycosyltransferase involved in cell wall biosynthesis